MSLQCHAHVAQIANPEHSSFVQLRELSRQDALSVCQSHFELFWGIFVPVTLGDR